MEHLLAYLFFVVVFLFKINWTRFRLIGFYLKKIIASLSLRPPQTHTHKNTKLVS